LGTFVTPSNDHRVQECIFSSAALGRDMRCMVILPDGYATAPQRFPVLYLLHGWNGDYRNWCTLTNLVAHAQRYPIIVVTPEGGNSWYVNSATVAADRFYDYASSDLIAAIDNRYRTLASRHARAMAGLSMGGYGSLLIALKHPELFAAVGSVSGAFDAPSGVENVLPDVRESTDRAYGPSASATRSSNNLFELLKRAQAAAMPYVYLQCGTEDVLLPSNRRFAAALTERKILHEYHEVPGDHTWEFWDNALPPMLKVIASHIVRP
jgi:putative tributyrin esterase